jgi:hypothetical protein
VPRDVSANTILCTIEGMAGAIYLVSAVAHKLQKSSQKTYLRQANTTSYCSVIGESWSKGGDGAE